MRVCVYCLCRTPTHAYSRAMMQMASPGSLDIVMEHWAKFKDRTNRLPSHHFAKDNLWPRYVVLCARVCLLLVVAV